MAGIDLRLFNNFYANEIIWLLGQFWGSYPHFYGNFMSENG